MDGGISVLVRLLFQLEYEHLFKIYISSSIVFVCWCPFVSIFKCSDLQSHYTFFQVHQTASNIVAILYNQFCICTGD